MEEKGGYRMELGQIYKVLGVMTRAIDGVEQWGWCCPVDASLQPSGQGFWRHAGEPGHSNTLPAMQP